MLCDTMFEKSANKQWTHQSWSTGSRRQIDFILLDSRLRSMLVDSDASDCIDFKSDHRCVNSVLQPALLAKRRRRGRANRQNARDLDVQHFHVELDKIVADPPADASALADSVVAAAHSSCRDFADPIVRGRSQPLQELLASRGAALCPIERKHLTKLIWSQLRLERRERENNKLDKLLASGKGAKDLARML